MEGRRVSMIKSGAFASPVATRWLKYGSDILMTLAMILIHPSRKLKIM